MGLVHGGKGNSRDLPVQNTLRTACTGQSRELAGPVPTAGIGRYQVSTEKCAKTFLGFRASFPVLSSLLWAVGAGDTLWLVALGPLFHCHQLISPTVNLASLFLNQLHFWPLQHQVMTNPTTELRVCMAKPILTLNFEPIPILSASSNCLYAFTSFRMCKNSLTPLRSFILHPECPKLTAFPPKRNPQQRPVKIWLC